MVTIQDITNISTILSPIVVIITLINLAMQYRRNADALRTESLNTAIGVHVNQIAQLTSTEKSAELFRKFCKDFYSLSLDERGVMHSVMLERIASICRSIGCSLLGYWMGIHSTLYGDNIFPSCVLLVVVLGGMPTSIWCPRARG